MSVNYYAFGSFPGGSAEGEGLHIGQEVAGRRFLMRAHPDRNLTTMVQWMTFLRQPHVEIRAEHGVPYSAGEMEETIRARETASGRRLEPRWRLNRPGPNYHTDSEGVEFCTVEFC
ncbi:hypothetical protein [Streptomyces sp. NPDC002746]